MRKNKVKPWEPRFIYKPDGYIKSVFYDDTKERRRFSSGTKNMSEAVRLTDEKMSFFKSAGVHSGSERHGLTLGDALNRMWEDDWQFTKDSGGKRLHVAEVLGFFGDVPLSTIDNTWVRAFIAHLRYSKHNADSTINRKLSVLRKTLRVALQQWEEIKSTPFVPTFKEKRGGHKEYITQEEFDVIIKHCKNSCYIPLLKVLYWTGIRSSEAFNLKWKCVDWSRQCLVLEDTKNNETWITPLVTEALEVITELKSMSCGEFVFSGNQKGLNAEWNIGRGILEQSDNKKFTPYALRHTFARRMLRLGFSTAQVRAWLHHLSISTTESYIQLEGGELLEIRDGLNSRVTV